MKRQAFTLVELLVVIAIIGILVALLLPAVQAAREAARRMWCSNNVKQIGLALHSYEETYNKLPAAGRGYGMCTGTPLNGAVKNTNGLVSIMPYLELQNVYDRFDLSEAVSASNIRSSGTVVGDPTMNGNAAIAEEVIDGFVCPSDPTGPKSRTLVGVHYGPATGFQGAATNYDFITSAFTDFSNCNSYNSITSIDKRMFGEDSETPFAEVKDGLSNTMMIGETTKFHVNGRAFAWAYRGWVMTGIDPHPSTRDAGINLWHMPWVHPTWASPPYEPRRGLVRTWWSPAASLHPGGCTFGFGDGSVHFIGETIEKATLAGLARMDDGEVVRLP